MKCPKIVMGRVWMILTVVSVLATSSIGSPRRFRRRIEYYASPPPGAIIVRPFSHYGSKPTFFSYYGADNNGRPGPPGLSGLSFGQPGPPGLPFGPLGPVELSSSPFGPPGHIEASPPSGPPGISGTSRPTPSRWRSPASQGPQPPSNPTEFVGPSVPPFAYYAGQNQVEYNSKPDSEFGGWQEMMSEDDMSASEVNAALDAVTREEGLEPEPAHSRPAPAYSRRPPRRPAPDYEAESVDTLPLGDHGSRPPHKSSYSVPHYSVTSDKSESSSRHSHTSTTRAPPVKKEGESKLKAVAIWTHRSRGVAYTLHDDGSLTVERPRS